eukprot:gene5849-7278_t
MEPSNNTQKSEKQKMIDGELYNAFVPELIQDRENCRILTRKFNDTPECKYEERQQLLKQLFGTTGEKIYMESTFRCDYGYNIHVGENFYANFDCVILDVSTVTIGKNCLIGPGVHIYTAGHPLNAHRRHIENVEFGKAIKIGDNVWIGGRSIINPGVTIGDNAVIGSGSVVTKDVPANTVVAGNPAKVIRNIDQNDPN